MEQPLPGGFVNAVARAGDTVRRPPPANAAFVHALLRHLEGHGWPGAPRYLGTDAEGREVLSFVDGHVAWEDGQPPEVGADESLAAVARLVRQLHDLTAGSPLAGTAEVVCHNDLSPKNTVYRDTGQGLRPVAFIDWDLAAPGDRLRLVCDSYGLEDRSALVATVLWWQDRCWRGIDSGAAAGDPAMRRLHIRGAATAVRADHTWVTTHRAQLEAALA
jgi:aminoglycoside phosphotransferase (APT) family kinase protein